MGVRLDALPDYLARWQVPFTLLTGWQTRSRSSGDFADVMAVGVHHTASSTTPARDMAWMYTNSPDKPIGNGLLDRTGHFTLAAVRATNTQGRGGPYLTSRGVIPQDVGNTRMFAIEAANNGVGEPWPAPMIDTYVKLCAAVIECVSETTPGRPLQTGDIIAHFEWAPGRKFDPAGNSPYAAGGALWDMDSFRRDVYVALNPPAPPPPPPPPTQGLTMQLALAGFPTLQPGASGVWVKHWQAAVNVMGATLKVDGDYGPESQGVCRYIQGLNGLPQTGVVDVATWAITFPRTPAA